MNIILSIAVSTAALILVVAVIGDLFFGNEICLSIVSDASFYLIGIFFAGFGIYGFMTSAILEGSVLIIIAILSGTAQFLSNH